MTDKEIWLSLVRAYYPTLNESQLLELKKEAACSWWLGVDDKNKNLSVLFDQYVMMKNLRG